MLDDTARKRLRKRILLALTQVHAIAERAQLPDYLAQLDALIEQLEAAWQQSDDVALRAVAQRADALLQRLANHDDDV